MSRIPRATRRDAYVVDAAAVVDGGSVGSDPRPHALLMSIQPRYSDAILAGTKTVELRRRPPREHPGIVVIYSSGSSRTVVGTAALTGIHTSTPDDIWERFGSRAGVTRSEFDSYFVGSETASALELSDASRSAPGIPLAVLRQIGVEPPQSWRYLDWRQTRSILAALERASLQSALARAHRVGRPSLLDIAVGGLTSGAVRPLRRLAETARCLRRDAFDIRSADVASRHDPAPKQRDLF